MDIRFSQFFSSTSPLLLAIASAGETNTVLKALALPRKDSSLASADPPGSVTELEPPGDWGVVHFSNFSILQTGVGKSNAAGAVASALSEKIDVIRNYAGVLSVGIAGSLVDEIEIGSSVCATEVVLADEGTPLVQDREWTSLEAAGWAQTSFPCGQTEWQQYLKNHADHHGIIATISTISGTNEIVEAYRKRSNAIAEGMEGAAIAQVCSRLNVPFAEYRIISNRCGNRNVNKLDIPTSFNRLAETFRAWGFSCE